MNIQDLADKALKHFTTMQRDGETVHIIKDGAPEWVSDLAHDAHGRMMPDDFRFSFIVEALEALSRHDSQDDAMDSIEPDIYNRDLLAWVSSNLSRAEYVDNAVDNQLVDVSSGFELFKVLQAGQLEEKREVFYAIVEGLEEREDEIEAA